MRLHQSGRSGLTLIELVVVVAIAGLLVAILVPAVMQARSSARTLGCKSNLRQIGLATHSYIDVHRRFPGGSYLSRGPLYDILSFIEQDPVYQQAEAESAKVRSDVIPLIPVYLCPDDPIDRRNDVASYLVNQGLLPALGDVVKGFSYEPVKPSDVRDGLSSTAFFSESITNNWRPFFMLPEDPVPLIRTRVEFEQLASRCLAAHRMTLPQRVGGFSPSVLNSVGGYNHLLPPNAPVCSYLPYPFEVRPPVGGHSGGVNVLFADGTVRFVNENIDREVWWNVGTINGGEKDVSW